MAVTHFGVIMTFHGMNYIYYALNSHGDNQVLQNITKPALHNKTQLQNKKWK